MLKDSNSKQELAYSRLFHELFSNGPIKVVSDRGHVDLVNDHVRLCSNKEPFLDAIETLQTQGLVQISGDGIHHRSYALTEKGVLTASLAQHQRVDELCSCRDCADALEEILCQLIKKKHIKMIVGRTGHPHLVGETAHLCAQEKPFLKAICKLERLGFVSRTDDFTYLLTRRGELTARLMLSPQSKQMIERSMFN